MATKPFLHFANVSFDLPWARAYPQNVTKSSYPTARVLLTATSENSWGGSLVVIHMTAGNFGIVFHLLNRTLQTIYGVQFSRAITIDSEQVTFSYVSSVGFLSLEPAIIALIVSEVALGVRTKNGHNAQQSYS